MRSNYIWLGLVPAVAKVMQSVDDKVAVNFGGNNIVISTQLPFSWQLFYWGAIAFVLAHLAYIALCPALIRDHRDFQEYINRGYISSHIADIYKKQQVRNLT